MKVKLLRKVIARARFCAHINSVTTERLWNGKERVVGVSVGYGVTDYKPYQVLSSPKTIPPKMPYFRGIPRESGFCTQ